MPLTNAGRDFLVASATAAAGTPFNAANTFIGVGDSTTAHAFTQTDLVGTNKFRKGMDGGYPTVTNGNIITARATFATGDANFAWNEWGLFNAGAAGTMLNRRVESLGTKPASQSWQFTVTVTINAA